jgi:hypothetical protein
VSGVLLNYASVFKIYSTYLNGSFFFHSLVFCLCLFCFCFFFPVG